MSTTVIVFAKAPVPGVAKTRLAPALGTAGAAALAARLLDRAMAAACEAALGPVELCATPDAVHPAIVRWGARTGVELGVQGEGDLGARMQRALTRALQRTPRALLLGTDAPAIDAPMLRRAARALEGGDAVFVPALDGGYALVGLRGGAHAHPRALFAGVEWSTPRVMAQTRTRAAAAGLVITELPPVADIDEPADLRHLPPGWLPPLEGAADDVAVHTPTPSPRR